MDPERPEWVIKDVGRKIAERRQALGLTQEEMAERIGMPLKNYQRIERGLQNLTIRSLVRIAAALQTKTLELFGAPLSREVRRGRPPRKAG
jgi:transcriptional regulator with XRE-family HTH domain